MIGFACSCELCQDEEINNDDETYEKFQKLKVEAENDYGIFDDKNLFCYDLFEKAISGQKQMYNLAKKKKAQKLFIQEILWNAFTYGFSGYELAISQKNCDKMEYFKRECEKLSEVGYKIAKMCLGQECPLTKEWKERNQDFKEWYKKNGEKGYGSHLESFSE